MIQISETTTPIGALRFAVRDDRVVAAFFADGWAAAERVLRARFPDAPRSDAPHAPTREAFDRYFGGDLDAFEGLDLDIAGTPFQRSVWDALRSIEPDRPVSYSVVARQTRAPRAVRAAGTAVGSNPLTIIIPCHRVVRSDGSIGNYGGGVERKRWLLDHERVHATRRAPVAEGSSGVRLVG